MLSFPSITRNLFLVLGVIACSSTPSPEEYEIMHGTIAYPFMATEAIGRNRASEKFIIRSIAGENEYVIEIPNGAENYEIEIPLAEVGQGEGSANKKPKNLAKASKTDRELTSTFPRLEKYNAKGTATLDKAFGTSEEGGPRQSPSYTLGLAKINKYYRQKNYEYSLIQINDLLSFYPNSPKLYKMKGTILIKIQNLILAEKAWSRAFELSPSDKRLKKSLANLRKKISRLTINNIKASSNRAESFPVQNDPLDQL